MENVNETHPCDQFDSLTSLILAVGTSQVNVTAQIQSCPNLCSLAWGAGNPDFSGVGANLSWIVQAVLTFLLGPFLIIGVWFDHRFKYPPHPDHPRIEAVHKGFFAALGLVTVPVTFASLIYLRNVTFLFEVTYLYYLNTMQFLSLFSATFSGFIFHAWDYNYDERICAKPEKENKRFRKNVVVVFCLFALAFYLGVTVFISSSRLSFPFLPDLTAACRGYDNIIPKLPNHVEVPPANWEWLTKILESLINAPPSRGKASTLTVLALTVMYAGYWLVVLILGGVYWVLKALKIEAMHDLLHVHPGWFAAISMGISVGMLYCLVQMQIDRNSMRNVIGEEYVDDQWGFGQILCVFLWTQVLWEIGKWIFCTVKRVRGVPLIRRRGATPAWWRFRTVHKIAYELSHRTERSRHDSTSGAAHGCTQYSNLEGDSVDEWTQLDMEQANCQGVVCVANKQP